MWYNKYMENEVKNSANTSEDLVALRSENEKLKAEIKDLKQTLEQLMEQIRLARHKRFGASSEKNTEVEQLSIFNEAEIYEDAEKTEEELTVVAGHTRRKKKEYTLDKLPEGIPVEIVEHRIPESKLACPQCGETMTPIGKEVTRKLKIIPARTVIVEDHYYSYACRNCEKENIQSRSGENARSFLSGFKGYLHTDGYAGYHNFSDDITVVGCWSHARRRFDEAVKSLPKDKKKGSSAAQGLAYCDRLFALEKEFAKLTPEERYEQRLKQEKPVLDAFSAWAEKRTVAPKSALGKAMSYLKDQWPYLTNYLKDGRLEISNNRAERSIKSYVIDRNNFLFANTPSGATGSAVMFSLIMTALENKLDPWRYLTWLMKNSDTVKDVEELLPWNAPDDCKI